MPIFDNKNDTRPDSRTILPVTGSSVPNEPLAVIRVPSQLVDIASITTVVGSTSAAFQIGKCTGSTPAASATPLLTGVIEVSGSADLPWVGALINSAALQQFAVNDRLVLIKTGYWPATMVAAISWELKRI